MKVDLADKESLEAKRAQQEAESRENCKLISEQKAVRQHNLISSQAFSFRYHTRIETKPDLKQLKVTFKHLWY